MVDCICRYPPSRSKLHCIIEICSILGDFFNPMPNIDPQNQVQRGKICFGVLAQQLSPCVSYHIFCAMYTQGFLVGESSVYRFIGHVIHVVKNDRANRYNGSQFWRVILYAAHRSADTDTWQIPLHVDPKRKLNEVNWDILLPILRSWWHYAMVRQG